MSKLKPMLAGTVDDLTALTYPRYASPKLDGIRALVKGGVVLSRSLKPIPNAHVQKMFGCAEYEGFDGELMLGDPTDPAVFRNTTSAVMSEDGEPDVAFHVFDLWNRPGVEYFERYKEVVRRVGAADKNYLYRLTQSVVDSAAEAASAEEAYLDDGYEGMMLRDPKGFYKFGRATLRGGELLKVKRFNDSEARVLECVEQMHNTNEAKKNELGRTQRSTAKDGMVPKGTLGALRVVDIHSGVEFDIGTGFDDAVRADLWKRRTKIVGSIVKYKYFPTGSKDKPRFPVWLGFRDKRDMS